MLSDRCPACGHRFGLHGPDSVESKPASAGSIRHVCPVCAVSLQRRVPRIERVASLLGLCALLIASGAWLWQLATGSPLLDRHVLLALYAVSVVSLGIAIVIGAATQHYSLADSD